MTDKTDAEISTQFLTGTGVVLGCTALCPTTCPVLESGKLI